MHSQEEWRKIAYQQHLGQQGTSTGNIYNRQGLDDFERTRREQQRQAIRYPHPRVAGVTSVHGNGPVRRDQGSTANDLERLSHWCESHIWPLHWLACLGERLRAIGWRGRLPLGMFGALSGAMLVSAPEGSPVLWPALAQFLSGLAGEHQVLAASGLGALTGWFTLAAVGGILLAVIGAIAYLLALCIVLAVVAATYAVLALVFQWPLPV